MPGPPPPEGTFEERYRKRWGLDGQQSAAPTQAAAAPVAAPEGTFTERYRKQWGLDAPSEAPQVDARVLEEALPFTKMSGVTAARNAARQISDPGIRAQEMGKLDSAENTLGKVHDLAGPVVKNLRSEAAQTKDPAEAQRINERAQSITQATRQAARRYPGTVGLATDIATPAVHAGSYILGQLARPDTWAHRHLAPDVPPPQTSDGLPAPDPGQWDEFQRRMRVAQQPEQRARHPIASRVMDVADAASRALVGGLTPHAEDSAITGVARGGPGQGMEYRRRFGSEDERNAFVEKNAHRLADFGVAMATSPTNALGFGYSAAKNAANAALRTGMVEGLAPAAAKAFAQEAGELAASSAGKPNLINDVLALGNKHGIQPEAITRTWGQKAEHFGAGQLTAGIPFTSIETQPIPALTAPIARAAQGVMKSVGLGALTGPVGALEYPAGKALVGGSKAVRAGLAAAQDAGWEPGKIAKHLEGPTAWLDPGRFFDPDRLAMKDAQRGVGRGTQSVYHAKAMEEADAIAQHAGELGVDKDSLRRIVTQHLDHGDYQMVPLSQMGGMNSPAVQAEVAKRQALGLPTRFQKVNGETAMPVLGNSSPYWPRSAMTPAEQTVTDELRQFFQKRNAELRSTGALAPVGKAAGSQPGRPIARNWSTGEYFPRVYDKTIGYHAELPESALAARGGTSSFTERTRGGEGVPAGLVEQTGGRFGPDTPGWYTKGNFNPLEVLPTYIAQASRAQGRASLGNWLGQNFGKPTQVGHDWTLMPHLDAQGNAVKSWVPNELKAMHEATFDKSLSSLSGIFSKSATLRASGPGRSFIELMNTVDRLGTRFRGLVTSKTPGFNVRNTPEDVFQMLPYASPGELASGLQRADQAFGPGGMAANRAAVRLPTGQTLNAQQLAAEMHGQGLATELLNKGDVAHGAADDTARLEKTYGRALNPGGPVTEAARKVNDVVGDQWGQRYGQYWRARAEGALYIARRERGDSPAIAARHVWDSLIDYGGAGRPTQALSNVVPFSKYLFGSVPMTAKAMVQNPGAVLAVDRAFGSANPQPTPGIGVPQNVRERGPNLPVGEDTASQVVGAVSGGKTQWPHGLQAQWLPPSPLPDALAPWEQMAQGNPDRLLQELSPGLKYAAENLAGRSMTSKQDITPQSSLGAYARGMFLRGTPGVPERYQTESPNNPGLLSQVAWPYAVGPMGTQLTNEAVYALGGGAAKGVPFNVAGYGRPLADAQQPDLLRALQRLSLLTRRPMYAIPPSTAVMSDQVQSRAVQSALKNTLPAMRQTERSIQQAKKRGE